MSALDELGYKNRSFPLTPESLEICPIPTHNKPLNLKAMFSSRNGSRECQTNIQHIFGGPALGLLH